MYVLRNNFTYKTRSRKKKIIKKTVCCTTRVNRPLITVNNRFDTSLHIHTGY